MTRSKMLMLSVLFSFGTINIAIADNGVANMMDDVIEQPVNNSDPCTVFFCMAGMVYGESPSECGGAKKKFFSIIGRKRGVFHPGRTFDARKNFLGGCPSASADMIGKILNKYGKLRW